MSLVEFMKGPVKPLERNLWKVSSQSVSAIVELINLRLKAEK